MKDIKLKDKIAQGINDLFYIWKREFQTTFRDQGVLIFFILVPLGYPLLYSFIYDNEVVREVPAVVVDDSHSSLSREYLRKVDATPDAFGGAGLAWGFESLCQKIQTDSGR